jgi:hypothetical protein
MNQTNGARLIVVSDGEENVTPYVYSSTVQIPLQAANVIVDTVAISSAASQMLSKLASDYGGQSFFLNTNDGANALNDAVSKMCQLSQSESGKSTGVSVQIVKQQIQLVNTSYTGNFFIDDSVGNETLLTFSGNINVSVQLTTPSGSTIGTGSPEYQISNGNIYIRIADAKVF